MAEPAMAAILGVCLIATLLCIVVVRRLPPLGERGGVRSEPSRLAALLSGGQGGEAGAVVS